MSSPFYIPIKKALLGTCFIFAFAIAPLSAHAVVVPTYETNPAILVGIGTIAASATVSAEADASLTLKEYVLDALVPAIRQGMITTITNNIVAWINNGFDGGPGYVTNLGDFLGQIADNTALDFLQGTELGFLCSPFKLEVRLAAIANYRSGFTRRISCSLGDVADAFLGGDFLSGGWQALFRLSTDFSNNPYSAYLQVQDELSVRIASRNGEELRLLSFGNGIFSPGKCIGASATLTAAEFSDLGGSKDVNVNTRSGCERAGGSWQITTPGAVINEKLSQTLGSGFTQLELADEIDEIIGATLAQVIQQVFTSVDGLSGLSRRNSSSARNGRSYLEEALNEADIALFDRNKEALVAEINGAIQTEGRYQAVLGGIAEGYQGAQDGLVSVYECATTGALSALASTATTTAASIQPTLDNLQNQKEVSEAVVLELQTIVAQANAAETPQELDAASGVYRAAIRTLRVHTSADVTLLLNESEGTHQVAIAGYNQQVTDGLAACGL